MIKFVIGTLLLAFSVNANANICPIVVSSGVGSSYEDAKYKAFREAIEQYAGVIILSESEVKKYKLIKNEIFSYSAHYIDSYKIISHVINQQRHHITLEACVSSTKIANRILSKGETVNSISGEALSDVVNTFTDSRNQAGKLIEKVMDVYPRKAFEVDVKSWSLMMDKYNNPVLNINYFVYWNKNFLDSFQDAASATQNGSSNRNSRNSSAIVFGSIPRSVWGNIKKSFGFQNLDIYTYTDSVIYENLQFSLETERFPFLLIELSKSDNILHSFCRQVVTDELYYFGYNRRYIMVNKNGYFNESLKINESNYSFMDKLKQSDTIRFKIASKTDCKKIIYDK
jgi:hypothetical protein